MVPLWNFIQFWKGSGQSQPAPSSARTALLDWESQGKLIPALQQYAFCASWRCFFWLSLLFKGEKKKICLHNKVDSEGKGSDSHHSCCSSFTPQWFSLLQTLSLKQAINKSLGGNAPTQHIKSTISPSTEWHSTVVVSYVMIFPLPRHLWVFSKILCYIILGAG